VILNNIGWTYHKQRKYLQALPFYERSIKLNRNIVNVWNSKAVTLYKLKKYPEALKCCEKAIKLGTKDKETLDCFKKIKKMITKQPTKKQTQPRTDPKGSAGQYYFI
jgi:tetratricopeptide (TPR) repeat protein